MADHDVEGHLEILLTVWLSPSWNALWSDTACDIQSFERLEIPENAPDAAVWQLCQQRGIVLITGNRNAQGSDSLEMTIEHNLESHHLPVFTIADPDQLMRDRGYAERVAGRLIEYLQTLDNLRGSGRVYLP